MYKYPRFASFALVFTGLLLNGQVIAEQPPRSSLEMLEEQIAKTAPVFMTTELPDASEGKAYSGRIIAQAQGAGNESAVLLFKLVSGPDGFELADNGRFSWLPGFESAGEHRVKVTVSDGELTAKKSYALVVANTNREPVWESESIRDAKEGLHYTDELSAKDPDGDKLVYSLQEGPEGLQLSAAGVISWDPGFFTAGKHIIKVSVADSEASRSKAFKLQVENSNREPEWQTGSLGHAAEGQIYEVQLAASDVDQEELKYTLVNGPEEMRVGKDGLLRWTPGYDAAGKHTFTVTASDPYSSVDKTLTLVVDNTNRQPVIRGDLSARLSEMSKHTMLIEADDPDGDSLSYKIDNEPEGVVLKKNVLTWQPGYEQAGEYTFTLTVSDAESSIEQQVRWEVKNTNRLPEWKTESLGQAKENSPYRWQLEATDADRTTLSYQLESGPKGMVLDETGVLSWLPDFETSGSYGIEMKVSDGEDSVLLTLPLSVENTNRTPEFTSTPVLKVAETETYRYKVKVDDPDREPLTVKISKAPKLMELVDNELVWTPTYEQAGEYEIELELADAEMEVRQAFTLTVENTNRPPVFTVLGDEEKQLAEDVLWKAKIQAIDADRQNVELTLHEGPEGLSFENNTLLWQPGFEQAGEHRVLLSASDGESRVDYGFSLSVKNVNRLPSFVSQPVLTGKEVEAYQYTLEATDPDRTPLVYSIVQAPQGVKLENTLLTWVPDYEQSGKHQIILQVADGEAVVEQAFIIDVENTNRAPIFNTQPVVNAKENSPYSYTIDVSDADRTTVALSLAQAPDGMRLKKNVLSWEPDFESSGSYPVVIEASDKEVITLQSFNLTVENTNRLPVVSSKPVVSAIESFPYSYTVKAEDADRQALTYKLTEAPAKMVINDNLIDWIPGYNQQGNQRVVIDIFDGEESVQQAFTIKVANTNREPNIAYIEDHTIIAGDRFKYQFDASDKDGDKVEVKVEHGPKGMIVKSNEYLLWETDGKDIGSYTVIVSVSDGDLVSRTHFELHVLQRLE